MATTQATSSALPSADFDYWSLNIQVRDIEWSTLRNSWITHLIDYETRIKGAMEVCINCVTPHVYYYCDGTHIKQFESCDVKKPIYHPTYIQMHEVLEPNNAYVRAALNRTPRRQLVPTGPHGITMWRGYDPKAKLHSRHVDKCFRSASPAYIIQGTGGLGHSIYYRRCDRKFRNLAHQVLKMGEKEEEEETAQWSLEAAQGAKEDQTAQAVALVMRGLSKTTANDLSIFRRAPDVTKSETHKHERED